MSLIYRLISVLFALCYRIQTGEWLIGLALAWWGLIRESRGESPAVPYTVAVLVVLLGMLAKAMDYLLFVPSEGIDPQGTGTLPINGVATGRLLGYLHPSFPLLRQRFHLGVPVCLYFDQSERPPRLLVVDPPSATLPIRSDSGVNWTTWYPGSTVTHGTVYLNGREPLGLSLSFAGRRTVITCEDDGARAAIRQLLTLPDQG